MTEWKANELEMNKRFDLKFNGQREKQTNKQLACVLEKLGAGEPFPFHSITSNTYQ